MKESERRALFARARGEASPSATDKRRIRAALTRTLAATAATSVGATTATKAAAGLAGALVRASATALGKATLGLLAVSTVAGVAVHASRTSRAAPSAVEATLAARPSTAPASVALPVPSPIDPPAPIEAKVAPVAAPPSTPSPRPLAPRATVVPIDTSPRAPTQAQSSLPPDTPPVPEAAPGASFAQTGAEIELMARIQSALRDGASDEVLSLVAEHERLYPSSAWAEDREGARVLALCTRASPAEAATLGERFLSSHRLSTLDRRVRATCHLDASTRAPR